MKKCLYRIYHNKDSEPIKRFDAGQPIRFDVQEKGRFEPLSKEGWAKEFYATPVDFGRGVPGSRPNMRK